MTEAEKERADIVDMLQDQTLAIDEDRHHWPLWRHYLWAIFNYRTFYKQYGAHFALVEAVCAIERGDHKGYDHE